MATMTFDAAMKMVYEAKAQAPRPMADDAWERTKGRFRTTMRIVAEDTKRMIEDGEFSDEGITVTGVPC